MNRLELEMDLTLSPRQNSLLNEEVRAIINDPTYCSIYGIDYLNINLRDIKKVREIVYSNLFLNKNKA